MFVSRACVWRITSLLAPSAWHILTLHDVMKLYMPLSHWGLPVGAPLDPVVPDFRKSILLEGSQVSSVCPSGKSNVCMSTGGRILTGETVPLQFWRRAWSSMWCNFKGWWAFVTNGACLHLGESTVIVRVSQICRVALGTLHRSDREVDSSVRTVRQVGQVFEPCRVVFEEWKENTSSCHHSVFAKKTKTWANTKILFFGGNGQLFADFCFPRGSWNLRIPGRVCVWGGGGGNWNVLTLH